MNKRSLQRLALALLPALLPAWLLACSPSGESEPRLSTGARLSGDTSGYPKATQPRDFEFPADHGPHPEYKHEWWYVTGQLETDDGRRFGFQFTIFREAVAPQPPDSRSRWATNQLYLGHAAVTDVEGERHLSAERYARGALGLAGARAEPLRVWLEDWALAGEAGADGELRARIVARSEDFGLELTLNNTRPPVAHGDRGLSRKGAEGNASYYYSYTRLGARGSIQVGDTSFDAAGNAWLDHEWSSSALQADQSGWDWLSLQLSNGADLMVFRLRHRGDPGQDFYNGTYVAPSDAVTNLDDGQIRIEPQDYWSSERTGARYPVHWQVSIPRLALELTIDPWLENQEFVHSFRYWEGAVRAEGRYRDEAVIGNGYLEMTGYGSDDQR